MNGVDLSSSPYQHPEDQRNCIEFGGKWQQMEGPIRAIVTEPCTCYGLSKKPLTQLSQSDIEYVQAICRPKGWW